MTPSPPSHEPATRDAGRAAHPRSCCTTTSTAGCGPQTIVELAAEIGHELPGRPTPTRSAAGSPSRPTPGSLERYLETFDHTVAVMQTRRGADPGGPRVRARTWPTTASCTPRCATPPSSTSSGGLTLDEVVAAVQARLRRGRWQAAATGGRSSSASC